MAVVNATIQLVVMAKDPCFPSIPAVFRSFARSHVR